MLKLQEFRDLYSEIATIRYAANPDFTSAPNVEAEHCNVFVGAYVGRNHYVGVGFQQ